MKTDDLEILSGFDAVWQRVMMGASCPLPKPTAALPEQVMDGLYGAWQGYGQLACRSRGKVHCGLQELAGETKYAFRELQTVYFLQTGELYHPSESEKFASCTMSDLRKLWKNACNLLELLQSAASDAGNPYRESMKAAENLMQRHKERLKCMIRDSMG